MDIGYVGSQRTNQDNQKPPAPRRMGNSGVAGAIAASCAVAVASGSLLWGLAALFALGAVRGFIDEGRKATK